jgi:hypothetical protein
MQKAYKNELAALKHTRFDKKKNFVFLQIFHLKYDTQDFHNRNVHVISIYLKKLKIYIKNNY